MRILNGIIFCLSALRWGDWRHWKDYYPTILFFIMGDWLYDILTCKQTMWLYHQSIIPTSTLSNLFNNIFVYIPTVLMYLPHFPDKGLYKKVLYIFVWTAIYGIIEFIFHTMGLITYHNGWNFLASVLFDGILFVIIYVHYKRPIAAWLLSFIVILTLWFSFRLSISHLK